MKTRSLVLIAWMTIVVCLSAHGQIGQQDTVSGSFNAISVSMDTQIKRQDVIRALASLSTGQPIIWLHANNTGSSSQPSALYELANLVLKTNKATATCAAVPDHNTSYLFHIATWKSAGLAQTTTAQLEASAWYVYRYPRFSKDARLTIASLDGSGNPFIYGAKGAVIVAIDFFDNVNDAGLIQSSYATTVTQGTPQNITDLSALISGLTGTATQMGAAGVLPNGLYVAATCQKGTAKLPFQLQVTDAAATPTAAANPAPGGAVGMAAGGVLGGGGAPGAINGNGAQPGAAAQVPSTASAVCNGASTTLPCSMTRTFAFTDREFWDFSGGLAIPGVRETTYTFSGTTNMTSSSITRHTEIYAFADVFPFGAIQPKSGWIPHINVGLPITTKSLYRPYFGLAENITGWTHLQKRLNLPVALNAFAGVCFMKTEEISGSLPTTQATFQSELSRHRVWKPMFGIEVPISSIASKFGSKGGGGGAGGAKGTN